MPLNLMCRAVGSERNAQYKVTIESTLPALDIAQLFPGIPISTFSTFYLVQKSVIIIDVFKNIQNI